MNGWCLSHRCRVTGNPECGLGGVESETRRLCLGVRGAMLMVVVVVQLRKWPQFWVENGRQVWVKCGGGDGSFADGNVGEGETTGALWGKLRGPVGTF